VATERHHNPYGVFVRGRDLDTSLTDAARAAAREAGYSGLSEPTIVFWQILASNPRAVAQFLADTPVAENGASVAYRRRDGSASWRRTVTFHTENVDQRATSAANAAGFPSLNALTEALWAWFAGDPGVDCPQPVDRRFNIPGRSRRR